MSHGVGTQGSKAEPNLTPLLDVVLQLLMFFMMCANFVSTQVNKNIQLPVMNSARPADKKDVDLLYLNVKPDGWVEVVGRDPMKTPEAIKTFLNKQYHDAEQAAKQDKDNKDKKVKTVIVIRADQNAEYRRVYEIMHWCKEVGYRRFQMRAMTRADSQAS
jgi:biopolymer transport protein ExbD